MEMPNDNNDEPSTPDTVLLEDPFTPRTVARLRGDFGRLVPSGRESILAFHAVAAKSKLDPEFPPHCRQFIFIDEEQTEYSEPYQDSGPETEIEETQTSRLIWRGYYKFNATIAPPRRIIGCGRPDLPHLGVDLLLALPQSRSRQRILGRHGRHAVFSHEPSSGAFMISIEAGKTVYIDGKEQQPGQQYIGKRETNFRFGDLDYLFQYTGLSEGTYRAQLFPSSAGPPRSLELTPNESDQEVGGFMVQSPFAKGGSGVVSAGTHIGTGKRVAVKRI